MKVGIYVRVSTADQRDNGYSIDSQLKMLNEHCEKKGYTIVATYNDAGFSGKNLQRPGMQDAIADIANKKIDCLLAIKVDRLTRENYDGFWLLKYCENYDVKIELVLEVFDLNTLSGEIMYGMNLMFGQHERKQIGARTKRALEQMAISKIHPTKAPFGYIRNSETGRLEVNKVEADVVKEIFEMSKQRMTINKIGDVLNENNYFCRTGKWDTGKVRNILFNTIYIGKFSYRSSKRKCKDILVIDDYCEPIIDLDTWSITRININKNKHPNYGLHIHLFNSMIKCPSCGKILSSSNSMKNTGTPRAKTYYHLVCENKECELHNKHYNSEKIEEKLGKVLNELTRYITEINNEIVVSSTSKLKEIDDLEAAIVKLKVQEKKLVDLYMNSSLSVDIINGKSEMIKSEIERLTNKKEELDPTSDYKNFDVELNSKLNSKDESKKVTVDKRLVTFCFEKLSRKAKKEIIQTMISTLDISKDEKHNISISNIKFSDEFINKNSQDYINYVSNLIFESSGIEKADNILSDEEIEVLRAENKVYSLNMINDNYTKEMFKNLIDTINEEKVNKIIENRDVVADEKIKDSLILIPNKMKDEDDKEDVLENDKKVASF